MACYGRGAFLSSGEISYALLNSACALLLLPCLEVPRQGYRIHETLVKILSANVVPGRFISYSALSVDSFPRITVTDAFGRLNDVLAVAVIVARAGGPSGSAIPPLIFECH